HLTDSPRRHLQKTSARGIGSDQSTRRIDDDAGQSAVIPPAGLRSVSLGPTIPIGEPKLDRFTPDDAVALATQLGVWIALTKRPPGRADRRAVPADRPDMSIDGVAEQRVCPRDRHDAILILMGSGVGYGRRLRVHRAVLT